LHLSQDHGTYQAILGRLPRIETHKVEETANATRADVSSALVNFEANATKNSPKYGSRPYLALASSLQTYIVVNGMTGWGHLVSDDNFDNFDTELRLRSASFKPLSNSGSYFVGSRLDSGVCCRDFT
jgi:hypothetical protein